LKDSNWKDVPRLVGGGDLYTVLTNREPPRLQETVRLGVMTGHGFVAKHVSSDVLLMWVKQCHKPSARSPFL
jgi:hypothetical protein